MTHILLVEDDKSIVTDLCEYLTGEGFCVSSASGQTAALELLSEKQTDLVLLDISLAEGNGFSACSAIKAQYRIPVIFLTASGDEFSTVTGFELGADDYIAKPFRPRELVSRIRNVLRLTGNTGKTVKLGDVQVDTEKGTASKAGKDLYLSALEYRLLLVFINNRGIVLSRTKLLESIWDIAGEFVNDNTLTVYIKRLREKIEEDPQSPEIIKTVRGLGYRLDAPSDNRGD
ncbi:MAG: response regulator transcription factor [Clostridia bacterium]|nr:response regulator transcription factor [Clostridia bacterium]